MLSELPIDSNIVMPCKDKPRTASSRMVSFFMDPCDQKKDCYGLLRHSLKKKPGWWTWAFSSSWIRFWWWKCSEPAHMRMGLNWGKPSMAVELSSVTKWLVSLGTSLSQWDGEDYDNTHNLCCRPIPRSMNMEVGFVPNKVRWFVFSLLSNWAAFLNSHCISYFVGYIS